MQSIKGDERAETDFIVGGQANGIAFIIVWDGGVIDFDNCISCGVDVLEWVGGCGPYGSIDPEDIAYSVHISTPQRNGQDDGPFIRLSYEP